jgi:hypothetical protein
VAARDRVRAEREEAEQGRREVPARDEENRRQAGS